MRTAELLSVLRTARIDASALEVAEAIWLAFPLPYLLVIGTWGSRFERYAVPLLPFAALFAARAVVALVDAGRAHLPWLRRVPAGLGVTVAAGLLLALPVGRLVAFHRLLGRPDTREVAASWIEHQLPPGTRIAVEPYGPSLPVASGVLDGSDHEGPDPREHEGGHGGPEARSLVHGSAGRP